MRVLGERWRRPIRRMATSRRRVILFRRLAARGQLFLPVAGLRLRVRLRIPMLPVAAAATFRAAAVEALVVVAAMLPAAVEAVAVVDLTTKLRGPMSLRNLK